jgi:hypothetical protein
LFTQAVQSLAKLIQLCLVNIPYKTNKIRPKLLKYYSYSLVIYDNNGREHNKKEHHESINLAIQGMGENAQFSIAIAVGVFGILAIFVSLDTHNVERVHDPFWSNALWTQPQWLRIVGIVLSIAYCALVLFGIQSYTTRRLYEGIMGEYQKKMNEEWFDNDIREIAKENKLANWIVKNICLINKKGNRRYKGIYLFLFLYLSITFSLWFVIMIL